MPTILQEPMQAQPTFLTLGHVTRDVHPNQAFSLGGTVSFAALTAYRLGMVAAIVTCADAEFCRLLPTFLPEIGLAARISAETTTFANHYQDGFRTQYLRARAETLRVEDLPKAWSDASIILLGPLAQEFGSEVIQHFPRRTGRLLAATAQGWLRRWDADGRVWPSPWEQAETLLPALDVLILSHDDLLPFADGNRVEADAILARWSHLVPLLVATDGRHGATLFQGGSALRFPAFPTIEVDPTGAGDVFAAAFLIYLHTYHDPQTAVLFANCVASFSVEKQGVLGIPDLAQAQARFQAQRGAHP